MTDTGIGGGLYNYNNPRLDWHAHNTIISGNFKGNGSTANDVWKHSAAAPTSLQSMHCWAPWPTMVAPH